MAKQKNLPSILHPRYEHKRSVHWTSHYLKPLEGLPENNFDAAQRLHFLPFRTPFV
jgi:hypothetical protein